MKISSSRLLLFFTSFFLFININCTTYPLLRVPDTEAFYNRTENSSLADSLKNGNLTIGMPYYVIEEIFKDWPEDLKKTKIPVASIGSRQRLEEIEGWGRVYVDPDIKIFMDEYETNNGKLNVWYQYPDFYRMDVSSGDTLLIFHSDTVFTSLISNLKKSRVLSINDTLSLPGNTSFYSEIHYSDHQWREKTYWYSLNILSDGRTFLLKDLQYQIYPIELMEFENEPITSFRWR